NTTPSQCSTSATSQTNDLRAFFAKRGKRKVVDISSGEDGDGHDNEAGKEDGDDDSSFNDEGASSSEEEEEETKRTSTKRAKPMPSIVPAAASGLSRAQKNRFGFQVNPKSKVKASNQAASSYPTPSSQTLNSTTQLGTSNLPVTL
ncbi:hypothetical protein COCMIDRAFT_71480, partial [Bipolaris oryzae ATCC 44560]